MAKAFITSLSILSIFILVTCVFAQDDGWSKPVNGLRARLFVLPPDETTTSPFCRIMIELENVHDIMGQKRIRFSTDKLDLRVTDKTGTQFLKPDSRPYDGFTPIWETTLLPTAGTIKFKISFPGSGYRLTDKIVIDMGPGRTWFIPQDGLTYFLVGNLTIERERGDHPYIDWSGTLDLPPVAIPKAAQSKTVKQK